MTPDRTKIDILPAVPIDFETICSRQAQLYTILGFHKELDLSEQEYLESLPQIRPKLTEHGDFLILPMIVETRILWPRQAELANIAISHYFGQVMEEACDWQDDPQMFRTPKSPYITYAYISAKYTLTPLRGHEKIREEIEQDKRGGTLYDGIAFQIACPEFVTVHRSQLHLIGSQVGSKDIATLRFWRDHPELCHYWINSVGLKSQALVCSRNIDF